MLIACGVADLRGFFLHRVIFFATLLEECGGIAALAGQKDADAGALDICSFDTLWELCAEMGDVRFFCGSGFFLLTLQKIFDNRKQHLTNEAVETHI